ncbi:MAG TPA: 2-amino-3,7-dideoxy-D-threo-hept-6-ulosonate synthase [Planctomycetota bacterium]|nr:2-amino-3,7-dideoxy-D-threo-hept-6-ulosonate synthase [Planctomycetota bacterium]
MLLGKRIRLERILNRNTGRTVVVPMDHGVTVGPIRGLVDMRTMVNDVTEGGANAVLGHMGLPLYGHRRSGKDIGLILHLSGSTVWSPDPNAKVLVNSVETALKMGADAVSIHVNIGAASEAEMLHDLGQTSVACMEWGVPLLAMMYTRGAKIKSESDPAAVKHAARIAAELGADLVKVTYTGSPDTFRTVVEGCPIPVLIAGGEKAESDRDVFGNVRGALAAGGTGVCIGRNVFQHDRPLAMMRAICAMVHDNASVAQAARILGSAARRRRVAKSP